MIPAAVLSNLSAWTTAAARTPLTLTKLSILARLLPRLSALPLLLARLPLLLARSPLLLPTLSLLARLAAQWILPAPRQRLNLAAKAFDVVEGSGLLTLA